MSIADNSKAVFLSYASQDAEAARRICEALRAADIEVWFDQSELVGGDAWDVKIRKQIAECALFVPVISGSTQGRREGYFRLEWKLAAQRTHMIADGTPFLLPVVIDATRDAEALVPGEFKAVQWSRLAGGEGSVAFCARVKTLLRGSPDGPSGATPLAGEATALRQKRRPWLALTIGSVVVILSLMVWRWGFAHREPTTPSAGPTPNAPLSEARRLAAKARALIEYIDNATREELAMADQLCERALQLDSTDADVWATASEVSVSFIPNSFDRSPARHAAAVRQAQRAVALAPNSDYAQYALANCYRLQPATRPQALQMFASLIVRDPANKLYLRRLGNTHRDNGDFERAIEFYDRAAGLPGGDVTAVYNRGQALMLLDRPQEAEAAIDRSLAIKPLAHAKLFKITLLIFRGELDAARDMLSTVAGSWLLEDRWAYWASMLWLWRNEPESALQILRAVPRDFFENAFTGPKAFLTGMAQLGANRPEVARAEFQAALQTIDQRLTSQPSDAELLRWKTHLLARLGRTAEAERVLASFQATDNRERFGRSYTERALDAVTDALLGREDKALAAIEAQLEITTDYAPFNSVALRLDPIWGPLRNNPRFQALVDAAHARERSKRRVGLESVNTKSVAVLAFSNLSDDKANEYFSDGISEELSYVLGRIEGLKVVAGSSGAYFKGRDATPQEKGRMLGVNHLVEGSVARDGLDLRVIARVTSVQTGAQLWTDKFTGPANKPWDLQEEIARKVAKEFALKLGATGRAGTTINPEAHRLHLEARHFWSLRSFEGFDRAEACYRQALALEPESALLHAGLADVAVMRGWYAESNGPPNVAEYNRARRASERAIKLDPELSDAYAAPTILAFSERNWPEAERLARKAIALAPSNAAAHDRLGDFGAWTGRLDVALEGYGEAARLDPLSIYIQRDLVHTLLHAQRYEEVIATTSRARRVWPGDARLEMWRAWALYRTSREEEAIATLRARVTDLESEQLTDIIRAAAIFYLRTLGLKPEAEKLRQHMLTRLAPDNYLRGFVFAAVGDLAAFLPVLPRSAPAAGNRLFWGPEFDAWRENPQFLDAMAHSPFAQEYTRGRESLKRTTAGKAGNL